MKLLDFASMKKIKADEKTSTFKHADGHEIKILHKMLPRIHQEQIKRIPIHDEEPVKLDEGTPDGTVADAAQAQNVPQSSLLSSALGDTPLPQSIAPVPAGAVGPATQDVGPSPASVSQPGIPAAAEQVQPPVHQAGPEDVAAFKASNAAIQAKAAQQQQAYNEMHSALNDSLSSGVINPNHYSESQDSDQKTGTAVGLALMGFGGTGKAGLDFINQQIDRDVNAQKQNFQNKQTIFGAYKELYGSAEVATQMALATQERIVANKLAVAGIQNGTPLAAQRGQQLAQQFNQQADQHVQQAAQIHANGAGQAAPSRVLSPNAQAVYDSIQYRKDLSPEKVRTITEQYDQAKQVDKALAQIDSIFPQLRDKATWGGYASNLINPTLVGGALAAGVEGLGALGAGPTAGASLAASLPIAAGTALAGTAGAAGLKKTLQGVGGQQEDEYRNARDSLVGVVGNALKGANITPTEVESIIDQYVPTKMTGDENYHDKLTKLKEKIISLTHTSALDSVGMTNK